MGGVVSFLCRSRLICGVSLTCLVSLLLVGTPAQSSPRRSSARPIVDADVIAAVLRGNPGLTTEQAAERAAGQGERAAFLEHLSRLLPGKLGGAWFPRNGMRLKIAVKGAKAAKVANMVALTRHIQVDVLERPHSIEDLDRRLDRLIEGNDELLGDLSRGWAEIDVENNAVVAGIAPPRLAKARQILATAEAHGSTLAQGLRIRVRPPVTASRGLDVCSSREYCGPPSPLRGGIRIDRAGIPPASCSSGFTAKKSDGTYWLITAGHCGNNNSSWSHADWGIGLMRGDYYGGDIDSAAIRVNYWTTGGYVYASDTSPQVNVFVAITSIEAMAVGETVCGLGYVGERRCGSITKLSTPSYHLVKQVEVSAPSCHGDSGGSWVWPYQPGRVWAYGIHHASSYDDCRPTEVSWFTPLPTAMRNWPDSKIETTS